jgi:hypothetical protein
LQFLVLALLTLTAPLIAIAHTNDAYSIFKPPLSLIEVYPSIHLLAIFLA